MRRLGVKVSAVCSVRPICATAFSASDVALFVTLSASLFATFGLLIFFAASSVLFSPPIAPMIALGLPELIALMTLTAAPAVIASELPTS